MAWLPIPNNSYWEYDNAPTEPAADSPYHTLWEQQTNGIRDEGYHEVYVKCRLVGSTVDTMGEISKTYWDNRS